MRNLLCNELELPWQAELIGFMKQRIEGLDNSSFQICQAHTTKYRYVRQPLHRVLFCDSFLHYLVEILCGLRCCLKYVQWLIEEYRDCNL